MSSIDTEVNKAINDGKVMITHVIHPAFKNLPEDAKSLPLDVIFFTQRPDDVGFYLGSRGVSVYSAQDVKGKPIVPIPYRNNWGVIVGEDENFYLAQTRHADLTNPKEAIPITLK